MNRPTLADVKAAHQRIAGVAHRTPVMTCKALDEMVGAKIFWKAENLQKVGAFKFRGALNAVMSLDDAAAARGVVTHSSGNHAAALALAASRRGIPAYIVMPQNSPAVKQAAVAGYGGQITLCQPTLAARESTAAEIQQRTGATLIHPYNDHRIIAGQGTAAVELLEDAGPLDALLVPVGGGGLLSGTLIAAHELQPQLKVYGCEPAGADDAYRSWQAGKLIPLEHCHTMADGLRTSLGDLTFPIIHELVAGILLTDEPHIAAALRLTLERLKLVIEPSSSVPLACLLSRPGFLSGLRIGIILSGGNLDWANLPWNAS